MYQFVTSFQALNENVDNALCKVMTINVINNTSSNELIIKGWNLCVFPSGSTYQFPIRRITLKKACNLEEVLFEYDAFRERTLAIVCERIHEDPLEWTIL